MKNKIITITLLLVLIPFILLTYSYIFPRFSYSLHNCNFTIGEKALVCVTPITNWVIPFTGAFTNEKQGVIILSNMNLEYVAHESSHFCQRYTDDEQRATCVGSLTNAIWNKQYEM